MEEERDIEFDLSTGKKPTRDYLKYLKPIQKYFMKRYSIDATEFELMLFLYSEVRFTKRRLKEMGFATNRVEFFIERGYVKLWRKRDLQIDYIYMVSLSLSSIVNRFYDILEGKKAIPLFKEDNPHYLSVLNPINKQLTKTAVREINAFVNDKEKKKGKKLEDCVKEVRIRKKPQKKIHHYKIKLINSLDNDTIPRQILRPPDGL